MTFREGSANVSVTLIRGTSLMEILLAMLIVSILLESAFLIVGAERRAVAIAKENVIALYALESLRNKISSDIQNSTFNLKNMPEYTSEFKLPYKISWRVSKLATEAESVIKQPNSGWVLELHLMVPERMNLRGHSYIREVILP